MVSGHANPDRWGDILLELLKGSVWRAPQHCKRTAVIAETKSHQQQTTVYTNVPQLLDFIHVLIPVGARCFYGKKVCGRLSQPPLPGGGIKCSLAKQSTRTLP